MKGDSRKIIKYGIPFARQYASKVIAYCTYIRLCRVPWVKRKAEIIIPKNGTHFKGNETIKYKTIYNFMQKLPEQPQQILNKRQKMHFAFARIMAKKREECTSERGTEKAAHTVAPNCIHIFRASNLMKCNFRWIPSLCFAPQFISCFVVFLQRKIISPKWGKFKT